jgi:hypothetical protein
MPRAPATRTHGASTRPRKRTREDLAAERGLGDVDEVLPERLGPAHVAERRRGQLRLGHRLRLTEACAVWACVCVCV